MKSESEYNVILNKYNRIIAQISDLQQQIDEKERKWHEMQAGFKHNEDAARKLCEMILAKDPKEMKLGCEYTWRKLSLDELLKKASVSFVEYNKTRTSLLRTISDTSEQRRMEIEGLRAQLGSTSMTNKYAVNSDTGEILADLTTEGMKAAGIGTTPSSTPISTAPPHGLTKSKKSKVAAIVEEDEDAELFDKDAEHLDEMLRLGSTVAPDDIPVIDSGKKKEYLEGYEAIKNASITMDVAKCLESMTPIRWAVVRAIGEFGCSEVKDIEKKIQEFWPGSNEEKEYIKTKRSAPITNAVIQRALKEMRIVLKAEKVSDGLRSKFYIFKLSDLGCLLYSHRYGKTQVATEWDLLVAQHDNIEHGYGVKALQNVLMEKDEFSAVSMDRKENTIITKDGEEYIPDIKAIKKDGFPTYYEYERGTHIQDAFDKKLNKACKVTKAINIVAKNTEACKVLAKQVDTWISHRGGTRNLVSYVVRIGVLADLNRKEVNIWESETWAYEYKMKEGMLYNYGKE